MFFINKMLPVEYKGALHFQGNQAEITAEHQSCKLYDEFLKSDIYSKFVNNVSYANTLKNSNIENVNGGLPENELCRYWEWIPYLSAGYVAPEIEDMQDIKLGRAFLRVNKDKKVIYVVKKINDWYIFKPYVVAGTLSDLRLRPLSQYWIKKIPNKMYFKALLAGKPCSDIITSYDINSGLYSDEFDSGKLHSKHAFADKYGTIADITYLKGDDGKLHVDKVDWIANGLNPLPYLLPIDRKLIGPNYNESFDESEEKTVVSESSSDNESGSCVIS